MRWWRLAAPDLRGGRWPRSLHRLAGGPGAPSSPQPSPRCAKPSGSRHHAVAYYLDTSAAVKLVVEEAGSKALRDWLLKATVPIVSSDLLRTELLRATRRGAPDQMGQARAVLDSLVLLTLSTASFERAGTLEPGLLRSLDAVHLVAALDLGDDLDGMVTYDDRLASAATALGIIVVAPA